jgi:hypothetical protein
MACVAKRAKPSAYIEAQRRTEFERHLLTQFDAFTSHLRYRQYLADFPDRVPSKGNNSRPRDLVPQIHIPNNRDLGDYEGANMCRAFINSLRIDLE